MKHLLFLFITITALTSVSAHSAGDHATKSHDEADAEENLSRIESAMAQQLGIVTSIVAAQQLEQSIPLYGSLTSGPEQISHVRARFQGLIKSVAVSIGDVVKTGDLLAEVESNDSLKVYRIRAPISGRVFMLIQASLRKIKCSSQSPTWIPFGPNFGSSHRGNLLCARGKSCAF